MYDSWRDFHYTDVKADYKEEEVQVSSKGLAKSSTSFLNDKGTDLDHFELRDDLYLNMDQENASSYVLDLPADKTIYGVPEIHVRLKTDYTNLDGLMISAVLVDTTEDGSTFKAYMIKDKLKQRLSKKTIV